MVDNSKVLKLPKTLRVNHNDLRVVCSFRKIRLFLGAQKSPMNSCGSGPLLSGGGTSCGVMTYPLQLLPTR